MRKISHILLGTGIVLSVLSTVSACKSDSKELAEKEKELEELRQLADLDKKEMENQYAQFALQYDELKKGVKDDSLIARLDAEQQRAENLLAELKRVKSNDAAEIRRLKKELETVRAVLRTYILQVDSLQQLNQTLVAERDMARAQNEAANRQISSLNTERANLSEQVAIASQLNATGVSVAPLKKNGKAPNLAYSLSPSRRLSSHGLCLHRSAGYPAPVLPPKPPRSQSPAPGNPRNSATTADKRRWY